MNIYEQAREHVKNYEKIEYNKNKEYYKDEIKQIEHNIINSSKKGEIQISFMVDGLNKSMFYNKYFSDIALKQSPNIQNVDFICDSFENLSFENSLIYCDPPYRNTTGYKDKFNHDEFYKWCKQIKELGNLVFISEYDMPSEFKEVWKGEIKTNFSSTRKKATHNVIEKLFTI